MDKWRQIESLFNDALQRDPAERDEFVRQACGGDIDLQRDVTSLLDNHRESRDGDHWAAAAAGKLIDPSLCLESGQCLGPYRIQSFLAAGGMGKVYRAVDTRLGREIAIKVSEGRFSERFEREARTIASLNHLNICRLYDVGPNYLVMELVEGPTLADRIRKGPLPIDESLVIARQIAEALEAAHAKGWVHRDLKPANVKVTPEGTVKLLDFGLAKDAEDPPRDDRSDPTTLPTVILGTASYMSPEQVRGETVDKRTDVWSFGVVLLEMLSGRKAFAGSSDSEVLASIIKDDADFSNLPGRVPAALRKLLRRCLEKDPRQRLQAIGEARIAIDDIFAGPPQEEQMVRRPLITWAAAVLAGLAVLAVAGLIAWFPRSNAGAPLMQLEITPPEGTTLGPAVWGQLALSPNGRLLAFAATGKDGKRRLWLRPLESDTATPVAGAENVGLVQTWSPDNRWVAFNANGKFQRVDVINGGAPQLVCECVAGAASWTPEGNIIFARPYQPLQIVPASGGKPAALFGFDASLGETWQGSSDVLPDGKHFIYDSFGRERGAVLASLDGKSRRFVSQLQESPSRYVANPQGGGWLLFTTNGQLFARPLQPNTGKFTGDPVLVANSVGGGGPSFSVSTNGLLAFRHARGNPSQLTWFDRGGRPLSTPGEPGVLKHPRISPDQTTVAFVRTEAGNIDIWLLDLKQNKSAQFTYDPGLDDYPLWSSDGSRIIYVSDRHNERLLVERPANSTGSETVLFRTPGSVAENSGLLFLTKLPTGLSADGRWVIASEWFAAGGSIWLIPRQGNSAPVALTEGADASISPDGHWLLYATAGPVGRSSFGSNRPEVFAEALVIEGGASKSAGRKWQISTAGGANPVWRGDGKEIFYLALDGKMMSVPVESGENFLRPATPKALFQTSLVPGGLREYDVTRDGKRFLLNVPVVDSAEEPITVIVNWPKLMEKSNGGGF